ncbi:TRAP transporter large permease [Ruegeria marina]|uniref:TRAP transporter large permease protein n=1 Tax=Ruegeria marina TaxID=639004 RepID=A0A1G7FFJ2_9RHOB|nr:TRAP transporter large permease [Ruegeria marina]SDE74628.1 C4-dicarboxylate transporter, DctM subunit [Ruegeria marina]
MTGLVAALLLVAFILFLLVIRQPLVVILLAVTAFVHLVWGRGQLDYIVEDMWVSLDKELILAIPMFLLCGGVMTHGSTAKRLIRVAASLVGHLPGGLGVACIVSCGVFAAISGSSVVTMLAIGSVVYPAMKEAGYSNRFALGAVMSGGTLGMIIPPSIPLIIYGIVTETSIIDLFLAGVGPGLLLVTIFSIYAIWSNRSMPVTRMERSEIAAAFREGIWALLMPVILLGGIYSGYFTATESGAVALLYAVIIEAFVHRELKPADFYKVYIEAITLVGALFPLIAVALSLNLVLTENRVPVEMVNLLRDWFTSPLMFIITVNLLLLVVGAVMTTNEAILILAPLLMPAANAFGFDPVLFGIIMILNLEIGYLTPPVGLNLMVAMTAFRQRFGELAMAALPFIGLMILSLALVIWQPWIAMGLVG